MLIVSLIGDSGEKNRYRMEFMYKMSYFHSFMELLTTRVVKLPIRKKSTIYRTCCILLLIKGTRLSITITSLYKVANY
jgi:hypothetical protein